jgi:DNA-directed RNA polymerase subunit RPC12/RpoP
MIKRYLLYLFRWQLSTPILAPIIAMFTGGDIWGTKNSWIGSIIANLIGGLIFFWIDKIIFTNKKLGSTWHVMENIVCVDCGKPVPRGYRLVKSCNYDKTSGKSEYRCENCSIKKAHELQNKGILLYK